MEEPRAKGQLGQRPSRGSHNNGFVQETGGSICACLCVVGMGVLGTRGGEKVES